MLDRNSTQLHEPSELVKRVVHQVLAKAAVAEAEQWTKLRGSVPRGEGTPMPLGRLCKLAAKRSNLGAVGLVPPGAPAVPLQVPFVFAAPSKEQLLADFLQLLISAGVTAFSLWEKVLPLLAADARWGRLAALTLDEKRAAFDQFKWRMEEEKEKAEKRKAAARADFHCLLEDAVDHEHLFRKACENAQAARAAGGEEASRRDTGTQAEGSSSKSSTDPASSVERDESVEVQGGEAAAPSDETLATGLTLADVASHWAKDPRWTAVSEEDRLRIFEQRFGPVARTRDSPQQLRQPEGCAEVGHGSSGSGMIDRTAPPEKEEGAGSKESDCARGGEEDQQAATGPKRERQRKREHEPDSCPSAKKRARH